MPYRIGHGYDLHRLEPLAPAGAGKPLVLGGCPMTSDRGPIAHSDGDALYHALTDAILGAMAMPDIGQMYPDTDPKNESLDSEIFLAEAASMARKAGWTVGNVDATVILERPKIGPHKDAMRANIARVLGVDVSRVNVKGKTHEKVDAVGEGRAVEVHVVVMMEK